MMRTANEATNMAAPVPVIRTRRPGMEASLTAFRKLRCSFLITYVG
jgi:hypothetical protein